MSKEYIEREAAIKLVQTEGFNEAYDLGNIKDNKYFCDEIMNIPAADVVEVVKGKWESHGEGFKWVYICSVCGFVDGYPMNDRMNYCPNCGAKMDGGDGDA
jgi:rubrerythrin